MGRQDAGERQEEPATWQALGVVLLSLEVVVLSIFLLGLGESLSSACGWATLWVGDLV